MYSIELNVPSYFDVMHKPTVDVLTEKYALILVTYQDVKGMELKFIQFVLISYH